jgi:acetylornithine/succinyldiaminopimelate/putrescine aminotransferase
MQSAAELPVYDRLFVEIVEGHGVTVRTAEGKELLDFYGGHAVAVLGYRHPRLLAALKDQAERLFFQTNLVDVEIRREATSALAGFAPPGLDRVFLVNSGAEANENALRLAFRVTQKSRIICLDGAFHGRTAAAGACTYGSSKWYGFPRAPFDITRIPPEDVQALDRALAGDVAAVILEAVQGQIGARDLSVSYLQEVRRLTEDRGTLLIADEVQCGMGRTGVPFAIEHAGVLPDIITTAKGLAGGFPAGALITTEKIAASLKPGDLGTTFGGGPMASALIVAVISELARPGFLENVARLGDLLRSTCQVGPVKAIQGRGLLLGLRMSRPSKEVLPELLARGILAGGSGDPHVVRVMPPLIVEEQHIDTLRRALESITP